ncbi:glycoside hydrolase [candidate division KSB1 bacterium]|nr:glycoside hydrolase [candidate division KSB1 bacterium]
MLKLKLILPCVLLFVLLLSSLTAPNQISVPVSSQNKPWTRWWWPGSAVDSVNITTNLEAIQQAGFGGVEITPIYGVKGYEDKFIEFLSPEWMDLLAYTISEADRLDLQVDMTAGTGWPFGGPRVTVQDAAKQLVIKITAADSLQGLLKNRQVNSGLIAAITFDEKGKKLNITDNLKKIKPSGNAKIAVFYKRPTGQTVKRAAPGGEGFVMDHFSEKALRHYLARFDTAFMNFKSRKPRAFFNDSFEVYDANWTDNLTAEFKKRRGYDLSAHLDALAGYGDKDRVARVKSDYRQTVSDILLDFFTVPWTNWCHDMGSISRNQAHGSPANLIDLYAAVDIPETEIFGPSGFDIPGLRTDPDFPAQHRTPPDPLMMKFVSSAANLTGKNLASSESFTWLGEHFNVSLSQCKPEVDQLFIGGINHIFFHGTTFSPADEEWPGWIFYASTHFGPSNTIWYDIKELTGYITNCQSILQNSLPDNDILLYYPVFDYWYDHEGLLKYFTVHNLNEWLYGTDFHRIARLLWEKGFTFDYISDRLLTNTNVNDNELKINNLTYKTIVIPDCRFMPETTLKKLNDLAKNGANIIFHRSLPQDVPGLTNLQNRRKLFKQLSGQRPEERPGHFYITDSICVKLDDMQIRAEHLKQKNLQFIRKKYGDYYIYFISNLSSDKIDGWVPFNVNAQSVWISNPVQKIVGAGVLKPAADGGSEVYLQIQPGESLFLLFNLELLQKLFYMNPVTEPVPLTGDWKINFIRGGPELPETITLKDLKSWTELQDPAAACFSGTARYSISFDKPAVSADEWHLDLGRVAESARVRLNGKDMGTVWCFPFYIPLGNNLLEKNNLLEIQVTSLAANRIIDMDKKGADWKKFYDINVVNINYQPFNAADWEPVESGLIGPIQLAPMKYFDP